MTKRMRRAAMAALVVLVGCKGHEFEPPDRAARVAQADSMYSSAMFDTVQWTSDSARVAEGNDVYASRCDKCHGPLGEGGTEYAASRHLDVPSIVRPDWEFGEDHEAVRRRIFGGHKEGMPTWGVANLTPREIDAATAYLLEQLRPETRAASSKAN